MNKYPGHFDKDNCVPEMVELVSIVRRTLIRKHLNNPCEFTYPPMILKVLQKLNGNTFEGSVTGHINEDLTFAEFIINFERFNVKVTYTPEKVLFERLI